MLSNGLTRSIPLAKKAASYVEQASVPMPARMETYNLLQRFGREQVFTAAFLASVDAAAPRLPCRRPSMRDSPTAPLRRSHARL